MKTLVVYKSKSGFVQKYAEWIAQALSAEIFEVSKVDKNQLPNYDTIVYGGSLHAVGINGVKIITENLDRLKEKKIIVFATGASPSSEKVVAQIKANNFTPEQQGQIQLFYLRGGFNYDKLPPFDKFLMTLMKMKIKNKKKKNIELSADESGMLSAFDNPADFTSKENIEELVRYVKA